MPITRICLVRHGETDWNAQQRLQGHEDIALNARGRAQAQAIARALQPHVFSAIYHSDLLRAKNTATLIAQGRNATIHELEALRERHFGVLQGLTRAEGEEKYPGLYARTRTQDPLASPPGGGESLSTFAQRISDALHLIASQHPGETILIVSHGGCMDIMYRLVTGKPLSELRDFALGNATLNWIERKNDRWALSMWDEKAHLSESLDEISA